MQHALRIPIDPAPGPQARARPCAAPAGAIGRPALTTEIAVGAAAAAHAPVPAAARVGAGTGPGSSGPRPNVRLRALPGSDRAHEEASPDPPGCGEPALPPEPDHRTVQGLALRAFEVLEGMRAIAQLGPWITPQVAERMRGRRALIIERRTLTKDTRRFVARPGPAHVCRPRHGVIEAAVVLHGGHRSIAVAMRFEVVTGRWRTTDLTVL